MIWPVNYKNDTGPSIRLVQQCNPCQPGKHEKEIKHTYDAMDSMDFIRNQVIDGV